MVPSLLSYVLKTYSNGQIIRVFLLTNHKEQFSTSSIRDRPTHSSGCIKHFLRAVFAIPVDHISFSDILTFSLVFKHILQEDRLHNGQHGAPIIYDHYVLFVKYTMFFDKDFLSIFLPL